MWKGFWSTFADRRRQEERQPQEARDAADLVKARDEAPEGVIKEPPMEIDGRVMSIDDFVSYVEGLEFARPLPTRVFLHHTWKPTPETWRGMASILGMKAYYEQRRWVDNDGREHEGWTRGPHLFIAQDGIWLFSDLAEDGVGVYGHNYRTRHLEMVGDYDAQLPSGPILGATVAALGILHERLGLDIQKLNFHRDYSSKTCPGRAVKKEWIIPQVAAWIEAYRGKVEAPAPLRHTLRELVAEQLTSWNPQTALVRAAQDRGLLGALTTEIPLEIDDQGYIVQVFAEALLVPVNQWDKVRSLGEHERGGGLKRGLPETDRTVSQRQPTAPPVDPLNYQGERR